MRIKADQLVNTLSKKLASIYFLSGDEPLQIAEAADAIRKTAKEKGYLSRDVFATDAGFEWYELAEAANSISIFAERKVIDLRLNSAKIGTEGAKALTQYCQQIPEDTLLLITTPKLANTTLKTKWFQAIDSAGVTIQVWPLEGRELIQWCQRRADNRGLKIDPDGVKLLATRIEGNLLAAAQEIEKLFILFGNKTIGKIQVEESVSDNSRYDVFKLTDCLLSNRINRAVKILNGLTAEGIAPPVILWAITRETRLLIAIKTAIKQGQNRETIYKQHRLWDKRKQLVNHAISRLDNNVLEQVLLNGAVADRQIKGQEKGESGETLLKMCLLFHSVANK